MKKRKISDMIAIMKMNKRELYHIRRCLQNGHIIRHSLPNRKKMERANTARFMKLINLVLKERN